MTVATALEALEKLSGEEDNALVNQKAILKEHLLEARELLRKVNEQES